jgi:hypothetical protein
LKIRRIADTRTGGETEDDVGIEAWAGWVRVINVYEQYQKEL